jgi:hypothetical protein
MVLLVFIMFVMLPSVLSMASYYSTYSDRYAWALSALFLKGETPAAVLFIELCLVVFFYYFLSTFLFADSSLLPEPKRPGAGGNKGNSLSNNSVVSKGKRMNRSEYLRWKAVYYFVMFTINLAIMICADIFYVYIIINYDTAIIILSEIALAMIKLFWNYTALWKLMNLFHIYFFPNDEMILPSMNQHLHHYSLLSRNDILFLCANIYLNNLIYPIIAIMIISSNCFYNALFQASSVSSDYHIIVDYNSNDIHIDLLSTYDPPFTYSYQCSSVIYSYYCPVFILMLILECFLLPGMKLILKAIYSDTEVNPSSLLTKRTDGNKNQGGKDDASETTGDIIDSRGVEPAESEVDPSLLSIIQDIKYATSVDHPNLPPPLVTSFQQTRVNSVSQQPARLSQRVSTVDRKRTSTASITFNHNYNTNDHNDNPDGTSRITEIEMTPSKEMFTASIIQDIEFASNGPVPKQKKASKPPPSDWLRFPSSSSRAESMSDRKFSASASSWMWASSKLSLKTFSIVDDYSDAILLFDRNRYMIRFTSYMLILIAYGTIFPPLALIICLCIYFRAYYEEVKIGKLLVYDAAPSNQLKGQLELKLMKDCEGLMNSVYSTLLMILPISMLLFSYLLFDTFGMGVNIEIGLIPLIIFGCICGLIYYGTYCHFRKVRMQMFPPEDREFAVSESSGFTSFDEKHTIVNPLAEIVEI